MINTVLGLQDVKAERVPKDRKPGARVPRIIIASLRNKDRKILISIRIVLMSKGKKIEH